MVKKYGMTNRYRTKDYTGITEENMASIDFTKLKTADMLFMPIVVVKSILETATTYFKV